MPVMASCDAPDFFNGVVRIEPCLSDPAGIPGASCRCSWQTVRINGFLSIVHVLLRPASAQDIAPRALAASASLAWAVNRGLTSDGLSVFSLILTKTGYVTRGDFPCLRLQGAPDVVAVHDCVLPLDRYMACDASLTQASDLVPLAEYAAAIVQWSDLDRSASQPVQHDYFANITRQLQYRLNAPWICTQPLPRLRVALVYGRPDMVAGGPVYRAPDTEENRTLRQAFLATDMTEDSGVADRIIQSLSNFASPVHGIFTLSDNFVVAVAKAASALGLPTCPVPALATVIDKHQSRQLQDPSGRTGWINSVNELQVPLQPAQGPHDVRSFFSPSFPVTVKPAKDLRSECASKVDTFNHLAAAVAKATARQEGSAVIEPFFDGPGIHVNFVLLDVELLFFEVADQQPCEADAPETLPHTICSSVAPLIMPSAIPADKQETAKATLHRLLIDLGLHTGVFHAEARMVNSRYEYRKRGSGIVDLTPKPTDRLPDGQPECHLLEINARPPGCRATVLSRYTYGVDYLAAHILACIGDYDRFKCVAVPFDFASTAPHRCPTAQFWASLVYITAPADKFTQSEASCEELRKRCPDLVGHIVLAVDCDEEGGKLPSYADGTRTFVAHLLVASNRSRQEAIELGEQVCRALSIDIKA